MRTLSFHPFRHRSFSVLCLLLVLLVNQNEAAPRTIRRSKLKPIIIIPGNGGSQLEVKIDREPGQSGIPGCKDKRDWFRLWMNVWELFPENVECWASYMKLEYNYTTGRSHDAIGVTSRVPGWGETHTIEFIDPSWTAYSFGNVGSYLAPLVKTLVKWGYERNVTVRGAPYDFRFAPHSLPTYFDNLRELVEDTYTMNGNQSVVLLAHSQGGIMTLYFLRQQSQEWKDQYIHAFMAVNTPWGGSDIMLNLYTSGFTSGVSKLDPMILREEQRTAESGVVLLPRDTAHDANETLVFTPYKNYTIDMYNEFFDDIGFPLGNELMEKVSGDDYLMEHPNVDMYCWHGSGYPTAGAVTYDENFPNAQPIKIDNVEGDNVVSRRSLRACQNFLNNPSYVNSLREFKGGEHVHIFTDIVFKTQLKRMLLGKHGDENKERDLSKKNKFRFFSFFWD